MFTGIIEEIGQVKKINKQGQAMVLTIQASLILEDIHLGDSIAVNGVCLTVTSFNASTITVDVMPETFRKTNLTKLSIGSRVNLERAMMANGRFGGHIVQGHVDGTGVVHQRKNEENAVIFTIVPSDETVFQYIINQGSITLDGISLTVVESKDRHITVSIIPHTLTQTILNDKQIGDTVNIECDLLGKYVKHIMEYKKIEGSHAKEMKESFSKAFLIENGF